VKCVNIKKILAKLMHVRRNALKSFVLRTFCKTLLHF